jgi:hypothetical protein
MMNRSSTRDVIFTKPFTLPELDGVQPAGRYTVETEEELLPTLSFEAWRRISTTIRLPARSGGREDQVVPVDPESLEASLACDARDGSPH